MARLVVVTHPLAQVAISRLRAAETTPTEFRRQLRQLSALLFIEATRELDTSPVTVTTPMARTGGVVLARRIVFAPVLRAALGMLDGIWPAASDAEVAHLGICRDEVTARPRPYYSKFPADLRSADVFALDPMLATGQSAVEAVNQLKAHGASRLTFLCVISCPQGIDTFHQSHPDVPIITGAVDRGLDGRFYIVPGLGDAGDRYFGT
jgi:uracil phosphoribosyltransferase